MTDPISFVLDDDVIVISFVRALATEGLTIENIDGHAFRVRRLASCTPQRSNVVDLMSRRLRFGMHAVADSPIESA